MPSAQQPPKPAQAIWSQMQAPLKQASPIIGSQLSQVTPPVPQAWLVLPVRQTVEDLVGSGSASQQPLQLAVVQTHRPPTHLRPEVQRLPH